MKRTTVHLEAVAHWDHLTWAFWRAARGKRHRREVQRYEQDLFQQLATLQADLLAERVPVGEFRRFEIHDPKRRTIHAPVFRERVLHHALMAHLEPAFERYLVDDTFACRLGKGSWRAVQRAQQHSQRFPWFLKMDVRAYFASIDHQVLKAAIRRRIRGAPVLRLVDRIIDSHGSIPGSARGIGLPIGALTSQHFANLYLAALDRYLLETARVGGPRVGGIVRYMDDFVVWGHRREQLKELAEEIRAFAASSLRLEVKESWQLQRSERGLSLCGFRVWPGRIGLTARRRRRYRIARRRWEEAYLAGRASDRQLQAGYSAALAMTLGADAHHWRGRELQERPPVDA
ncbi:MAG: reverse transcriptase/maturase family protein [Acidobacteriota bacterium]